MEPALPPRIGPYRLLGLLGKGGMGQVHAAVDERINRRVALKVLSPEAARVPQVAARFLQEAVPLALRDHPGVFRVLESGEVEGVALLAMELLDGFSLRDWMQRPAGPSPLH